MELTVTPIETVLRTGHAEHTQLGQAFLHTLKQTLGIDAAACYVQTGTARAPDAKPRRLTRFLQKQPKNVNETILSIYYQASPPYRIDQSPAFKEAVYALFLSVLNENRVALYPTQKNRVDSERHAIFFDCMQTLAQWNLFYDAKQSLNRAPFLQELGIRVFCGHDKDRNTCAYYLILPECDNKTIDFDNLRRTFVDDVLPRLKQNDPWNAVNEESVTPIFCKWSELDAEQRFALCKE